MKGIFFAAGIAAELMACNNNSDHSIHTAIDTSVQSGQQADGTATAMEHLIP